MDALARDLMDHVAQPVFVLEPDAAGDLVFIAISPDGCALLDTGGETVLGRRTDDVFCGEGAQVARGRLASVMAGGHDCVFDVNLQGAGASPVHISLHPSTDTRGAVVRIIGTAQLGTNSKMAQDMQKGMEAINSEMLDFISFAAHDLRAPMRNVTQIAELLREDFTDLGDGKLELIDILEGVGVKAMRLISDVLSFAQATTAVAEVSDVALAPMLADIKAVLDPMQDHGFDCPELELRTDATALQIILRNLLDNAIKHTGSAGSDGGALACALTVVEAEQGMLDMVFQDNGQGFPPAQLEILNGGQLRCDSGFGLLAVRRLVEARGGVLSVSNCKDGASVRFSLPGRVLPQTRSATQAA